MTLNPWKRITELETELKLTRRDRDTHMLATRLLSRGMGILEYDIERVARSLDGITNGTAIRIRRELDNILSKNDEDITTALSRLTEQGVPVDLDQH